MTHPGEQFYPEGVRWDDTIVQGTLPDLLSEAAADYAESPVHETWSKMWQEQRENSLSFQVSNP